MLVNNENNGGFITISKYLFLLSLFLFWVLKLLQKLSLNF
jgi:hypothetical protein